VECGYGTKDGRMNLSTLFQRVIYFSIVLVIFVMVIAFLDGMHIFGPSQKIGMDTVGKDAPSVFQSFITEISGLDSGLSGIWLLAIGTSWVTSAALVYLSGSFVPLAITGLGTVFWTAYIHAHTILSSFIPSDFMLIIDVAMIFIFVGAVYGILGAAA
jgi:hypothetical protein